MGWSWTPSEQGICTIFEEKRKGNGMMIGEMKWREQKWKLLIFEYKESINSRVPIFVREKCWQNFETPQIQAKPKHLFFGKVTPADIKSWNQIHSILFNE